MGRRNQKKSPHPPGTTGIEGGSRHLCSLLLTLATTVASLEFSPHAQAAELGYGGRLAEASGAPVEGPVPMSVRFYTAPTGGDPVGPTLSFPDTPLFDGIFQLTLSLNDLQMNQVFGSGDHEVYVEVASQGQTYPRQKFLAVPYALRIPVDGDTLTYGTDGRLKVESISQSQVSGLALALSAKADANTVAATLAGKADTASVTNQLAAKADATALATKAAVNASLSGDVSGTLNGTITVDKIKNTTLPTPNSSQDGGKYLQYNGAEYVLSSISGSSGGTVTSVTASLPLSVTNGSTTPALTMSVASGVSDGYLTSSDFTAFNNKQAAITTSSTVNAGTLTTAQQNGLQIKPYSSTAGATGELRLSELVAGGSEYVGFKAPDAIGTSKIWTLPAVDGANGQVLSTNGSGLLSWVSPGNSGTVTSVNLTAPTNGITVTGGPITGSGSITISLADDLAAVEALSGTGGVERTGANTWGTYTITAAGKSLLGDVDATAQRTTLGLGTLATASSVSGGTGGTIADDSITDADINASAGIAQSKISGLTTALSAKEPTIAGGTSSQYYRGDKTWQTLGSDVVTEGSTNLYFTNTRARNALSVSGAPLAYNSTNGVLSLGQASSGSDGYLTSSDFTAFNNKQSAITTSSTVNVGTLTTAQQNGLQIKPYSSTAGATGELRLSELDAGGSEYVGFKAPDAINASKIWTLPAADGSNGQVLSTNGSGLLSWVSPGNSGTVTSVNLTAPTNGITVTGGPITGSGSITISLADDLAAVEALSTTGGVERTGANTWGTYTLTAAGKSLIAGADAAAQRTTLGLGTLATASSVSGGTGGTIADDSITDADINASAAIAQSKIAGLTTSLSGKEPTIAAGTTTQYYRGDKTWQTLGSDIVTEGTTNLYFTNTRARNALSVSGAPLSYNNSTGVLSLGQASSGSDGHLSSSDFTAFNNKQGAITTSSTVNAGTLTSAQQIGLQIKPYSTTAGATGELRLSELVAGGSEYVGFKAPDAIGTSKIWTLPAVDGVNGQVLSTNGSGLLSWVSPGNSGTVTSVNLTAPTNGITVTGGPITSSGSITISLADDLAAVEAISTTGGVERTGTNTWGTYTLTAAGKTLIAGADAAAQRTTLGLGTLATASSVSGGTGGTIADDSITDADINASAGIAQSKISGLTTALSGKEPTIAGGTSSQYYRGDKTWQTLGSDIVTEGSTNLYFTNTRARNALSVSGGLLSYNSSTGVISLTSTGSTSGTGGGAASNPSSGCPSGYILVPGDTNYGTTDFCVMKYEAKYGLKGAESRMTGLPARGNVSQIDAKASCRNLGPGYALINNAEWMTLATNVANRASNWSGNAVGSGALNRGHSDNAPANALAASTDTDACNGTGQTCSDTTWNDQRRTHTLSNGNVIWDLAGNVWEWVDYNNYEDKPTPATAAWTEYTGVTGTTTMAKMELVPTIAQTGSWNGATNGIGQYYAGTNSSGGALRRGGGWGDAAFAGVFTATLNFGPSVTLRASASAVSSGPPALRLWVPRSWARESSRAPIC